MEQDFSYVTGTGIVSGIPREKADELAAAIRRADGGVKWGRPVISDDGVRVKMHYGPVLGAWQSDMEKVLKRLAALIFPAPVVEVTNVSRTVIAARAEYDRLVEQYGKEEACRRLTENGP